MKRGRSPAIVALILIVSLIFAMATMAQTKTRFGHIIAQKLTVQAGGATMAGDLTVTGDTTTAAVTTSGAVVAGSTLAVTGATTAADMTSSGDLALTAQTGITLTQSGTLTPTGSYQPITAAGAISFGTIATGDSGDLLILENTSNTTITITDTGTLKISGNTALAQYDTITLISDGTNWIEVAQADN